MSVGYKETVGPVMCLGGGLNMQTLPQLKWTLRS